MAYIYLENSTQSFSPDNLGVIDVTTVNMVSIFFVANYQSETANYYKTGKAWKLWTSFCTSIGQNLVTCLPSRQLEEAKKDLLMPKRKKELYELLPVWVPVSDYCNNSVRKESRGMSQRVNYIEEGIELQ